MTWAEKCSLQKREDLSLNPQLHPITKPRGVTQHGSCGSQGWRQADPWSSLANQSVQLNEGVPGSIRDTSLKTKVAALASKGPCLLSLMTI